MAVGIHSEVCHEEEAVAVAEDVGKELVECVRLSDVEEVGPDQVDCCAHLVIRIDEIVRIVVASHCRNLGLGVSEDEAVLEPCLLGDLDVGSVQGSDGQRSVEHELHVSGSGSLKACSGDLLGEVGCRDDVLGHGNAVVGHEEDLELPVHAYIRIDHCGQAVDELDGELCIHIAGCALSAEEEGRGREGVVEGFVVLELLIDHDDVECIQKLALVLMDSLDLNVEDSVRVDDYSAVLLEEFGGADLVGGLDFCK